MADVTSRYISQLNCGSVMGYIISTSISKLFNFYQWKTLFPLIFLLNICNLLSCKY